MLELKEYVRTIPNFPREGVMFRDITTVLQDAEGLRCAVDEIQSKLENIDFDTVISPEARGFIFGLPIAYNMKKSFIPVRKKGKLPYDTVSEEYQLEYGTATLEMHKDAICKGQRVVIIDDLLATGGTTKAIINLIKKLGGEVAKICYLIELPDLNGRKNLEGYDVSSVLTFEGE